MNVLLFNQFPVSILLLSGKGLTRPKPTRPKPNVYIKIKVKKRDKEKLVKANRFKLTILFCPTWPYQIIFVPVVAIAVCKRDIFVTRFVEIAYLRDIPIYMLHIIPIFPFIWIICRQDFYGLCPSIEEKNDRGSARVSY